MNKVEALIERDNARNEVADLTSALRECETALVRAKRVLKSVYVGGNPPSVLLAQNTVEICWAALTHARKLLDGGDDR